MWRLSGGGEGLVIRERFDDTENLCLSLDMKKKLINFVTLMAFPLFTIAAFASENGANDYLQSISPKEQAKMLGKVVGSGCKGRIAFYQGSVGERAPRPNDAPVLPGHEHDSIWNVKCTNGKSYSVSVSPTGAGQVLECTVLEAVGGGHCFKKFE